jgi:hypothetical protein
LGSQRNNPSSWILAASFVVSVVQARRQGSRPPDLPSGLFVIVEDEQRDARLILHDHENAR